MAFSNHVFILILFLFIFFFFALSLPLPVPHTNNTLFLSFSLALGFVIGFILKQHFIYGKLLALAIAFSINLLHLLHISFPATVFSTIVKLQLVPSSHPQAHYLQHVLYCGKFCFFFNQCACQIFLLVVLFILLLLCLDLLTPTTTTTPCQLKLKTFRVESIIQGSKNPKVHQTS